MLLNNDIEAINQGWFEEMLSHALRSEIGCVGAKLLYPDGLLQHGGVIVGINGGAGHSHKFSQRNNLGYCGRLCIAGSTTAVTGACLMIRKKTYNDAGGMDENSLRIAFNDVDFCLRVEKLGYRNFWTPFTDILHHESATRGDDQATLQRKKRFSSEVLVLQNRWSLKSFSDRYYNPNLTYISETFRYGLKKLKEDSSKLSKYDGFREKKFYDSGKAYRKLFNDIADQKSEGESTFITVGGESKKIGEVSLDVLREFGLKCTDTLVDVGCGYGRLTEALSKNHRGIYLGTDVVPQLLNYAKSNFAMPGWRFELVQDFSIPSEDNSVDMICFFSVFTHLLHEQSFKYLKDVHRSLRNGGRVVFSFLDFCDPTHIPCFEASVTEMNKGHPLNTFMNEDLIRAWAKLIGFDCVDIIGPDQKNDLGYPFTHFGQSIACLQKNDPIKNKKGLSFIKDCHKNEQNEPKEFDRNQYKETWNKLSENFESAKIYVTGNANEKDLKESSEQTIKRIDGFVNFSKNDVVLEIGCGIGRVGKQLAPLCKEWIGCDISGNMLKYTKFRLSNLKNIKLVELPKSNLSPIPDGSIDVIYSTVVFMHLEEWDRYKYVSEAYRVLKKGGRAYFDNFSLNTKEGWEIFMAHYNLNDRPSHISKSSTSEELAEYLKKSKFKNIVTKLDDPWVIASGIK